MVRLSFYGGVGEIGGNKVLLEDRGTRIFIDFGMSFSRRSHFYDEFLNPRAANALGDFLRTGLTPDLKGIYRQDLLRIIGREAEENEVDAVLLSHAHMDHASYISFLHEGIPVYCGETCKLALEAIQEAGGRDLESEILSYRRRDGSQVEVLRDMRTFRTGEELQVGSVSVEPVHVDHSIPGDYGFIIRTSLGAVVYTSDFRMHGTHPEMTEEFIERAGASDPVALITEGTRIDERRDGRSEPLVRRTCGALVEGTDKLVVADFSLKDVDRLRTFLEIARENDRRLVVTLKDAHLLKYWHKDPKLNIPGPEHEDVQVLLPKRVSGKYRETDYPVNSREFYRLGNTVKSEEVGKIAKNVIACLGFYDMGELLDADPEPGSLYIYSASEPHNEEMVLDLRRLKNWVGHLEMRYEESHASGHATGDEVKELVEKVGAKHIYPIHTEKPSLFKEIFDTTVTVEYGRPYDIRI